MVNIFNLDSNKGFFPKPKYKILFVAAEAAPFAQVGGLSNAVSSLVKALRKIGQDTRIMMPRYKIIDEEAYPLQMEYEQLRVPTGPSSEEAEEESEALICNVKKYEGKNAPPTYFLENMEYYEKRANVYGYADDPVRWALLSRGTLEFLKVSKWVPDIIVACDWQTGFLVNYLATTYKEDPRLSRIASVFSIHNIYHQGMFDHHFVSEIDYDAGRAPIPSFFDPRLLKLNGMRRGIMYATVINTVSPTYAQEILTPEYGEGLEKLLGSRRARLYGILNGIDYNKNNPEKNPYVPVSYSAKRLKDREKNQPFLQRRFSLKLDPEAFIVSIVSRLDEQKGIELIMESAEPLIKNFPKIQMVILGDGDGRYKDFFQKLHKKFPKRVGTHLMFDSALPHLVYSGSDIILVPSRFEPCGLTQMEAMRYGAIPVVRKTGGLADTVEDFQPEKDEGTGFVFEEFNPWALFSSIIRARESFRYKDSWKKLIKRAMEKDFSWDNSAKEYLHLFSIAAEYKKQDLKSK